MKDFAYNFDAVVGKKEFGDLWQALERGKGAEAVVFERKMQQLTEMLDTRILEAADEIVSEGEMSEAMQERDAVEISEAVVFKSQFFQVKTFLQALQINTTKVITPFTIDINRQPG